MLRRPLRSTLASAVTAALTCTATAAFSAPGDLDTTFATDGSFNTTLSGWKGEIRAIKPLADGSVLAAGTGFAYWDVDRYRAGFATLLARFKADGTLDPAFATSGVNVTQDGFIRYDYDIALAPSGQIIVAGKRQTPSEMLTLHRFNADGTLDTAWGTNGSVELAIGTIRNARVAVQADGAIVVAALLTNTVEALRFTAAGAIDNSFDIDGRRTLDFGGTNNADQNSLGLALQADGKILVGATDAGGYFDFAVWRLNPNGSPDTTFDNSLATQDGKAVFDLGYSDILNDIAVAPDGKIVLVGQSTPAYGGAPVGLVFRIASNGRWTTDFNGGSYATTDFPDTWSDSFRRVVVQDNGKIVALGHAQVANTYGSTQHLIAARYNQDGSLDPSFGGNGRVETPVSTSCDAAFAGAMGADGALYTGGESAAGTPSQMVCNGSGDFAVVRYVGDLPGGGDSLPPTVSATYPSSGLHSVPVDATLTATFSESLDPATVGAANVTLVCDSVGVSGSVAYDAATHTVSFSPAADLAQGADCTATLTTGITDVAGNALAADYSWSFATITAYNADTVAPTVTTVTPITGPAALDAPLTALFSEALDPATVTTSSFTLLCGGAPVAGGVTYTDVAHVIAFTPSGGLPGGVSCTATLTTDITDVAGNPLAADYTWDFTTASRDGGETNTGGSGGGGALDVAWLLTGLMLLRRRR